MGRIASRPPVAHRFAALDSWRGLAACMVVLYHVRAPSHVSELELVRNANLFVDFFFVLSGFVIASAYQQRLAGGYGAWRFILLRFGRLYPLHLATLAAFILLELIRDGRLAAADPAAALAARVFLVHGLGPFNTDLWNTPSWSISTEFFAYLAFAVAVSICGPRLRTAVLAMLVLLPLVLYIRIGRIDGPGYEMLRCLYGFAAGVATWHLYQRLRTASPPGTLAEVLAIAAALSLVGAGGGSGWSLAAPIVFAAVVLVFAWESGAGSRLLKSKPFVFLGTVSYSIYMVHLFVAGRFADTLRLAQAHGISLVDSKWAGDLVILVCLAVVVAISALTYRLIEAPGRAWFRRIADRPMVRSAA